MMKGQTRRVEVSKDQRLADFARGWGLGAEHLAWANGVEPTSFVVRGQMLTLPARLLPADPPRDGAVVNLAERGVYLFRDGAFVGFFPLAIGQESTDSYHTPTGSYKVTSRVEDPAWTAPDSDWAQAMEKDRIAPEDPSNPLGEYWFGIDHPAGGYGFHENTNPDYTGDVVSHGCMRLNPEHARRIYEERLLDVGMAVRIENQPVRLGKGPDGSWLVAVFPSTYGSSNGVDALKRVLAEQNLTGTVSESRMTELCQQASGTPVPIGNP